MKEHLKRSRRYLFAIVVLCGVVLALPLMPVQAQSGPMSTELATFLHRVDLGPQPLAAAARVNLEVNLAAVTAAWDQAIEQQ